MLLLIKKKRRLLYVFSNMVCGHSITRSAVQHMEAVKFR